MPDSGSVRESARCKAGKENGWLAQSCSQLAVAEKVSLG